MTDNDTPRWSEEERRALDHEAFVAEVLRRRGGASRASEPKPSWERLLNATAVTALVGVVGTGLLGQWVAGAIQERSKQRELALVGYREYLSAELATVNSAYRLVGSYLSAAEDLIYLTGPAFQTRGFTGAQLQVLETQKQEIRRHYNEVDAQWRNERDALGFLMAYYHDGSPQIADAWRAAQQAADAYAECASRWHGERVVATEAEMRAACQAEKSAAGDRIRELTGQLGAAREFSWQAQPPR